MRAWAWAPQPTVGAAPPAARHGHSATLVDDGRGRAHLCVVGGGTGNILAPPSARSELSDVAVLDVRTWTWTGVVALDLARARAPAPGRHHTACPLLADEVLIFGGGARPSNRACVLDLAACVAAASAGAASVEVRALRRGDAAPVARKMHAAASLLPWLPAVVVFGGWEVGPHFDDLWIATLSGAAPGDDSADVDEEEGEEDDDDEEEDGEDVVAIRVMDQDGTSRVVQLPRRALAAVCAGGRGMTLRPPSLRPQARARETDARRPTPRSRQRRRRRRRRRRGVCGRGRRRRRRRRVRG